VRAEGTATGHFDSLRIEQAVTNCVLNAIKFGAGKPVEMALELSGTTASIRIRDWGIGIDPALHARIFDRFVRASSVRHYGGFGLGLWIARQIVEASGGHISVTSMPGEGATFQIDLPLAPAPLLAKVNGMHDVLLS
jgi:signal transduction histidine kinase